MKITASTCLVALCVAAPGIALAQSQNTLVVAAVKAPQGFDGDAIRPGTQNVVPQVYEGLTGYARIKGSDGIERLDFSKPIPHLAERWALSADGKEVVFKLREGVKSFFGNEMSADDVVFGWEKSLAQKRTGNFIANASGVVKVEKITKYEVKFSLKAPSAVFLHAITNYVPAIYDAVTVKKHASADDPFGVKWIERNTAGFGAYHLESVKEGEQAVFVANPNYFGPKPFYTRVVYREVPSAASRFQLLASGQAQWVEELSHRQIVELQRNSRIRIAQGQGTSMASVRMNARFKPFDDVRVRRAVVLATDYDAINQAVFENLGTRVASIIPPAIVGHDATLTSAKTDYAAAKKLLTEAGHPNGIDIALEYASLEWWEEAVALQLQQSLAKADIRMTPKRITDADMRARAAMNKRDLPMFTYRDFPFVLDPIYKMFLDGHEKGASNRNAYSNPQFDKLIDEALVEIDPAKRRDQALRAQRLHAEDASWVYLAYPGYFEAMPQCMQGYVWYPDYHERWRDLRCVR